MKRSVSGKILSEKEKEKEKKSAEKQSSKKNRFLVTVNVLGSTGPIRFVVDEGESVNKVVSIALKMYARERRLPVLGSDVSDFLLYPANNAGFDALSPTESIGPSGARNFVLCKIQKQPQMTEARSQMIARKGNGSSWKTWLNKSFSFKVLSH
ncbi:hypothetical protein RHGRI_028904 [Rhododendron griersonianum]|uniref:DUF7054 domain-containing protein n=1 Tax=Rhododendron griersonianum TaxID=479676 RepID=A0AAV6IIB2_9ERIC|nr:hypothetical protein RHGRI_028904 [Rhododendron griersonianum]